MQASSFIVLIVLSVLVATIWGSKKRIGTAWSLFFLAFGMFILGIIAIVASPSLKKIPPYTGKFKAINKGISYVLLLMGLLSAYRIFSDSGGLEMRGGIVVAIGYMVAFIGYGIYFYNRDERHKRIWVESRNIDPELPTEVTEESN